MMHTSSVNPIHVNPIVLKCCFALQDCVWINMIYRGSHIIFLNTIYVVHHTCYCIQNIIDITVLYIIFLGGRECILSDDIMVVNVLYLFPCEVAGIDMTDIGLPYLYNGER